MAPETAPAEMVQASSKGSPLRWVTSGTPTNYNMLLFRTINREMQQPNANQDNLAPLFRNKLMPLRMWWLKHAPGALKMFKHGLEHKTLGVPGVINFVDARTSWFDAAVKEALDAGINQVVVVAAGFDTRAYRIGAKYKGVRFFEVDLPHASKKKQQLVHDLLQPEATFPRPTHLAANLARQPLDTVLLTCSNTSQHPSPFPALLHTTPAATTHGSAATGTTSNGPAAASAAAGGAARALEGGSASAGRSGGEHTAAAAGVFDPSQPSLFTVEGLVYYLPDDAVRELFKAMLRVAPPGSRVVFDFLHKEVLVGSVPLPPAYKVTATSVANKGEPFVSGIPDSKEAVQAFLDTIPATHAATHNTNNPTAPAASVAADAGAPEPTSQAAAAAADGTEGDFGVLGAAEAGAPERSDGVTGCVSVSRRWQVVQHLGPKEVLAQRLPHLVWDDALPPILSFYSFASAVVVAE